MSDPTASYGDPVREPVKVDDDGDVVGRAHEGLADAEAAGRDAVVDRSDSAPAEPSFGPGDADRVADEPVYAEPVQAEDASVEPERAEPVRSESAATPPVARTAYGTHEDDDDARFAMYAASADEDATPTAVQTPIEAETVAVTPVATTPSEPVAPVVAAAPVSPQPIFVQAPEAPRPRGNRGAAGAIGLLAAIAFGILYLAVFVGFGFLNGDITTGTVGEDVVATLTTFAFWVPVAVFFVAFWLLGAIINRGRWGAWVIFGLLVGIASYAGHILGQLFQAPFWELTPTAGSALIEEQLLAPLAIAALVIGRELTIWFGAWVAARGKRVTELNVEAQREYERTLEAGPQLVRG